MQVKFFIAFIIYLIIILIIGIISSKKLKNQNLNNNFDFILGGRTSGWLITSLSAHAADMSDWLFMGLPAAIYLNGIKEIWIPIGLLFGMFLSWQFIAKKIRISSERYNANTITSYLANITKDNSGIIITISALIMFFFFTIYLSVGIKGIGYVLKSAFGINYYLSTLLAVFVVVSYTLIGGFVSIAYIDLFQGIFLLLMLMIVPIYTLIKLSSYSSEINIYKILNFNNLKENFWLIPFNQFSWFLGYFGMPHILTKFMAIENTKNINKSKYFGLAWQFLALTSAVLVGLIGHAYFQAIKSNLDKPEFIFIEITKSLFNPWIAGIILCAILAATISTIDSQLLVIASTVAQDIYKNLINKEATQKSINNVYKASIIISAFTGLLIAWQKNSTIMSLVKYAWSGLGASFGPAILLSLYCNKINKWGIISAILTGFVTSISWVILNHYIMKIEIYSILPAFILSIISYYITTWLIQIIKTNK